jgi:hypothetical protein
MLYTMNTGLKKSQAQKSKISESYSPKELKEILSGNKSVKELTQYYANIHGYAYDKIDIETGDILKNKTDATKKKYIEHRNALLKIEEILKTKFPNKPLDRKEILIMGQEYIKTQKSEIEQIEKLPSSVSDDESTKNVDVEYRKEMPKKSTTKEEKEQIQENRINDITKYMKIGPKARDDLKKLEEGESKPPSTVAGRTPTKVKAIEAEIEAPIDEPQQQANIVANRQDGIDENRDSDIRERELYPSTKPVGSIANIKEYSMSYKINEYNKTLLNRFNQKNTIIVPTHSNIEKALGVKFSTYTRQEAPQPKPQKIPNKYDLSQNNSYRDD